MMTPHDERELQEQRRREAEYRRKKRSLEVTVGLVSRLLNARSVAMLGSAITLASLAAGLMTDAGVPIPTKAVGWLAGVAGLLIIVFVAVYKTVRELRQIRDEPVHNLRRIVKTRYLEALRESGDVRVVQLDECLPDNL